MPPCGMSKSDDLRAWVQAVLDTRGWKAHHWAKRAKVADSTISRTTNKIFTMGNRTLEKLEEACGIPFAVPLSMQERVLVALFRSLPSQAQALIMQQMRAVATGNNSPGTIDVIDTVENRIVYSGPERRTVLLPTPTDRRNQTRYSVVSRR